MTRMSIDVSHEMHKQIKLAATINNLSIKEYVVEILQEKMKSYSSVTLSDLTEKVLCDTDNNKSLKKLYNVDALFDNID